MSNVDLDSQRDTTIGGDTTGRDKTIHGDQVGGDKINVGGVFIDSKTLILMVVIAGVFLVIAAAVNAVGPVIGQLLIDTSNVTLTPISVQPQK